MVFNPDILSTSHYWDLSMTRIAEQCPDSISLFDFLAIPVVFRPQQKCLRRLEYEVNLKVSN